MMDVSMKREHLTLSAEHVAALVATGHHTLRRATGTSALSQP